MQLDAVSGVAADLAVTGSGTPRECFLGSGCIGYFVPGPRSAWSDGDNLYLSGYSGAVKKLDLASSAETLLPAVPFTIGPIAGAAGQLFVASTTGSGLGRIRLDTGEFTPISLPEVNVNVRPISALWTDGANLFVAQGLYLRAQVIRRIELATGAVSTIAGVERVPEFVNVPDAADGIGQDARFRTLTDIWGDGDSLYVTDRDNFSVRRIEVSTGAVTRVAGIPGTSGLQDGPPGSATFVSPAAVWGDSGSLYVADQNSIRQIARSTGDVRTLAGGVAPGARDAVGTDALFSAPQGLWGRNGFLYIADSSNRVVRQLDLASMQVTTLAGVFGVSGTDDGSLGSSRFRSPNALWGSGATLYVSDVNAIRAISLDAGTVLTVALLPDVNGGISGLWGRGNVLYASGYSSGSPSSATLYRIAIDSGQTSEILHDLSDPNAGLPISLPDARGISGNSTDLFIAGGSDNVVRVLTPDTVPALARIKIPNPGYSARTTTGAPAAISVAHARIATTSGSVTPAGFAVFALRQNGVLISEASVPAVHAIRSGRISASAAGVVNTGVAIANPNAAATTVAFYFTDSAGRDYGQGSLTLPGGAQIARFLTEAPFNGAVPIDGTFTFVSTIPVSAVALRGYVNERSEFLMTTLPVVDLSRPASTDPAIVTHFAAGGGWTTELVLVNPSDQPISGSLQFIGATLGPFSPSNYTIAPRASQRLQLSDGATIPLTGAVRVVPQTGGAPSAVCIFSFMANGIRVTEASVPDVPVASAFHVYAETTAFSIGTPGAIRNGLAITNTGDTPVEVKVEIADARGRSKLPAPATIRVEAFGHVSLFVDEIPLMPFGSVSDSTPGNVVRLSSPIPTISVVGLRGRYNERGDFLITSTPAVPEDTVPDTRPVYIPHIVNGGGYTTQFVILGATAQSVATEFGITIEYLDQNGHALALPTR